MCFLSFCLWYVALLVTVYISFSLSANYNKLECGPVPNVMAALPNIGGALCSTLQSVANAQYVSSVQ